MINIRQGIVLIIWLLSFFCVPSVLSDTSGNGSITVVKHPSVSTQELNAIQLRKIFSMRQPKWPDGQVLKVFVLNSKNITHQMFCKTQLRMFPYQLEQVWNKLTYSGLGDPPAEVENMEEMLRSVSQTPGAIGYIYDELLDGSVDAITVAKE